MLRDEGQLLTLADVKAIGASRYKASLIINSWFGILKPTVFLFGFNSAGRLVLRSKTSVTGPGSNLFNWFWETVTFDHFSRSLTLPTVTANGFDSSRSLIWYILLRASLSHAKHANPYIVSVGTAMTPPDLSTWLICSRFFNAS